MGPDLLIGSGSLIFTERSRMNDKSIDKVFGYVVIGVVGYFVVRALFPYLLFAVIGLLALRFLKQQK
jgi:hypothetical protein